MAATAAAPTISTHLTVRQDWLDSRKEPILEPDLPIVDPHHHLVDRPETGRYLLPSMAAEDFAWFLERKPGAYIWIGNGSDEGGANLHSPHYDFNDAILPLGASYWVRLAESVLSKDVAVGPR